MNTPPYRDGNEPPTPLPLRRSRHAEEYRRPRPVIAITLPRRMPQSALRFNSRFNTPLRIEDTPRMPEMNRR